MVKNTGEQSDEEVCKTKSGRVLSTGASGAQKSGCITHPPGMDVYTHLESLQIPHLWYFSGDMIDCELHC